MDIVIESSPENCEAHVMMAACVIAGKKPFTVERGKIDEALSFLESSNMIQQNPMALLLLEYISYDYFHRKKLKSKYNYTDLMTQATENGLGNQDLETFEQLLGRPLPDELTKNCGR